jgi:hypothetical protein
MGRKSAEKKGLDGAFGKQKEAFKERAIKILCCRATHPH